MDSRYYEQIFRRRSFHSFRDAGNAPITPEDLKEIEAAWEGFEPLYPGIATRIVIVPESDTSSRRGAQYCVQMYSEKKDGYLQNIGYLGAQLDLWLVCRNIGTLWLGMGRPSEKKLDGMEHVIMLAIHKIEDDSLFRNGIEGLNRKPVSEVWQGDTLGIAEEAVSAPSAMNSQPWHVVNEGGKLTVSRTGGPGLTGMVKSAFMSFYNRIDIGIFLLFLEVCMAEKGMTFTRELHAGNRGRDGLYRTAEYTIAQKTE